MLARDGEGAASPSAVLFSLRVLPAGLDTDGDGVPDSRGNAILVPNAAQIDTDGDGFGNAADPDFDNSGIVNFADFARLGRHVVVERGAVVPDDTIVLDGSVVKRAKRRLRLS